MERHVAILKLKDKKFDLEVLAGIGALADLAYEGLKKEETRLRRPTTLIEDSVADLGQLSTLESGRPFRSIRRTFEKPATERRMAPSPVQSESAL